MATQNKTLKFSLFFLGIGEETSRQGKVYSVGKFFDKDSAEGCNLYLTDGVKAELEKIPALSEVDLVLVAECRFDRLGLSLQSVAPVAK
jgi:hypothetical protein